MADPQTMGDMQPQLTAMGPKVGFQMVSFCELLVTLCTLEPLLLSMYPPVSRKVGGAREHLVADTACVCWASARE